jgi:aspartate aminotransferase
MNRLASRINRIQPSSTLAVTAKALELKAAGKSVISLSVGEPDFDTPQNIQEAAVKAMHEGRTRYTAVSGIHELRVAIANKLKRENQLEYKPDEVIVCNGGKHALFNVAMALFEEGDEVIIPAPYWVSYPDQVLLAGAAPVVVSTSEKTNFKITPDDLQKKITPKTKAIILNSPNNPTGAAYTKDELLLLATVCVDHDLFIISDEIYEHLVYDGFKHVSIASLSPKIKEHTITVNGVAKAYAMTGWRMGYAAGPIEIIKAMVKLQGQATSNINTMTQYACVEALNGSQETVHEMVKAFEARRNEMMSLLTTIPHITCTKPTGAFYVFPNVSHFFGTKTPAGKSIQTSDDLSLYLLEDALVATVAGSGFGAEGYLRLSYATDVGSIREAVRRVKKALEVLK